MKSALSILLVSVILLQICGKVFIFVDYELNKQMITEKYCVNKARKALHCNGMCHMIRLMQTEGKQDNQDKAPVKSQNSRIDSELFYSFDRCNLEGLLAISAPLHPNFHARLTASPAAPIFHPPVE